MPKIKLTDKQKIFLWMSLDIIATYFIPFVAIVFSFELLGGIHVDESVKGLTILYIFGFILAGGIFWRIRQIIKLSGKKGWQFALAKATSPIFFLFFWYILGLAEGNIEKLRFIFIVSSISHLTAIYFRYKAGKRFE